jgi:malonyl-CoA O-methyltransferase
MMQPAVIRNFNSAAPNYDNAASLQALVAQKLVAWAVKTGINPQTILDIGSGTGLVAKELYRYWPKANISASDASHAMLQEAQRKFPQLVTLHGDARELDATGKFDTIFSSMALHWLPRPRQVLQQWQTLLNPGGNLFIALPVEGSFTEWRSLCMAHNVKDGLWPLPPYDFADNMAAQTTLKEIRINYPSAEAFIKSMKSTGASTPRADHRPIGTAKMRQILRSRNQGMDLTYRLCFLQIRESGP